MFGNVKCSPYFCLILITTLNFKIMKSEVIVVRRGDFGHNWDLVIEANKKTKTFHLGQDAKFCSRVLGMSPRDVVNELGTGDFTNDKNLKLLGRFIVKHLGITKKSIDELDSWALCSE
jgi:hypothetical protein